MRRRFALSDNGEREISPKAHSYAGLLLTGGGNAKREQYRRIKTMAGRTENTSPIVDQAAPTDTTTEEISSEKTVQSAQAAAAVQVASPGRGAEYSIAVEASLTYKLVDPVLRLTQDDGDLVVHWRDGGHTTLEDYLVFAQLPRAVRHQPQGESAKFSTGAPTKLGTTTAGTRQENVRDSAPFTWPYSTNTPFRHEFRGLYCARLFNPRTPTRQGNAPLRLVGLICCQQR